MAGELIARDGQIQFGDLLLGSGTEYRLFEVDGWDDLTGVDQGDAAKPSQHGSWSGQPLAEPRVVTATGRVLTADVQAALRALRAATALRDDELTTTIVVRTPGGETLQAEAKIDQRSIPTRPAATVGYVKFALQWECPDPRRFGLDEKVAFIPPPSAGSGIVWPLTWPLNWGTDGSPGGSTLVNEGDAASHPLIVVNGPVTGPLITNMTTGLAIEVDLTVGAGEQLVIDTAAGDVRLGGADRLYTLTDISCAVEDFTLVSGGNDITFAAFAFDVGTPDLQIIYRDAYL